MKRELSDKERVIEEKNKEIVRLRIQIDDGLNADPSQKVGNIEMERKPIALQLHLDLDRLQGELKKAKSKMIRDCEDFSGDSGLGKHRQLIVTTEADF